jgi:hypothetical protein
MATKDFMVFDGVGAREGSTPEAWEGEVGSAPNHLICPPHPALSPRPAGERAR